MDSYPNDFLKLRNGHSPAGQAHKRTLDGVDAPYLTKRQGNTITRKKDEFSETRSTAGAEYLWGITIDSEGAFATLVADPENGLRRALPNNKRVYGIDEGNVLGSPLTPYVGAGYVLQLRVTPTGNEATPATFWPVLSLANGPGDEYLSEDPEAPRRSVSFLDVATITFEYPAAFGMPTMRNIGVAATGKIANSGFGFAVYGLYRDNPVANSPAFPFLKRGDTQTLNIEDVTLPSVSGRSHYRFNLFTAGKGKLLGLQIVVEVDSLPRAYPQLLRSADHGQSWLTYDAAFLTDDLVPYTDPPFGGPRGVYTYQSQLERLALLTNIQYVGNDTTMIFIPMGYVGTDGLGPYFAPMMFVGDGFTYTRVAWPADEWFVDSVGTQRDDETPRAGFSLTSGTTSGDDTSKLGIAGAQFSHGVGCLYMPVRETHVLPVVWSILHTRNFGATWERSAAVPEGIFPDNGLCTAGVIIRPYKAPVGIEAARDAVIVFAQPDYETGKVNLLQTDQNFTEFKRITTVKSRDGLLDTVWPDVVNHFFVNTGAVGNPQHLPTVFPAFPGEFDN